MRGKELTHATLQTSNRITPAYAGKRPVPSTNVMIFEDHPRLCGEKPIYQHRSPEYLGSPPPMRGKGFADGVLMPLCGITPAYAGKRHTRSWRQVGKKDHPRLCGEKLYHISGSVRGAGSPPPMRGKALTLPILHTRKEDHPRLCGEKQIYPSENDAFPGSPPPMRGKAKWDEWS